MRFDRNRTSPRQCESALSLWDGEAEAETMNGLHVESRTDIFVRAAPRHFWLVLRAARVCTDMVSTNCCVRTHEFSLVEL
jgi:hypothetical protein